MHKMWVRIITTVCIVALLIANPGMTVLADVMPGEAGAASEETELTQGDVAESAEGTDSAAMSSEETDAVAEPAEDTDSAAVSPEDADPSMDSGNQVKSEENDDSNSGVTESEVTETDIEEDLVGSIFPGGFEVDPGDTNWLNAIADGVQAQSGVKAATVTREFLTGTYRLGSLPQFNSTTVDGVNLQSSQCCGYANMFFYKLTGHTTYSNTYRVAYETVNSAARLKEIIAASKAGAHIRIPSEPHSMVFLLSEDGGFYMLHWNNGVGQCSYTTYEGFVSKYGGWTFYVEMPNDYPYNNDNSGPAYSDFHVGELREGAFTVMAHVTDSSGIQSVRYAIWTEKNGQDDLIWYDGHCTDGNDYYWARVNFSEHNGERGLYIIHMYAYDNNGNLTNTGITFSFDEEGPEISDVVISDLSSNGYTVTCKVTDPSGVLRVQFPTWTDFEGQDDLVPNWDTNTSVRGMLNGDNATFRVEASAHNNEVGKYYTHIYAFDILGNAKFFGLAVDVPGPATDINACTVSLSATSYTYNGKAKRPSVTVKDGSTTLISGTDYTVEYSDNINAGTATVIITGTGNYNGSINKTFTINQAAPKLTFADASISKTTLDPAFTNELTKTTDGTVTFNSTNKSVATVNRSSGKVTIKGAGTTTITVKAAAGTNYKAGSAEYTLTVTSGLKIVSISDDIYGKTGTSASFHIEAEGSGTISYQWQYRTTGMSDWKSPAQASAKTTDYVFNLKPSYDNIEIRCIVSDDFGNEVISETRKANVFALTSQPADATAWEGQVVNFEVSAIGHGATYQWYYMRPEGVWRKTTVAGSNTAILPITVGTNNNGTSYRCVVTDEAGNKMTSAAGFLTLDNSLRITGISEDAYDVNGESVTFHIDAVGTGDLSYQWQYKLAGSSKWKTPAQASAKTADYVFKLRPSYEDIEVRCIVQDASGDSVTSDVRKANVFAITGQPQDAELEMGEQTTFAVKAVGKELTYQWYYMRPESSWKKVTVAGYNTASLVITANNKNDGTKFQCRITDGLGNMLVSSAALLTQS